MLLDIWLVEAESPHARSVSDENLTFEKSEPSIHDQLVLPTNIMPLKVKGMMLQTLGRLPEALATLDHAIALAPEDVTVWRVRAAIRKDAGMLAEAISDLEQAIGLQPSFAFTIIERDRLKALLG